MAKINLKTKRLFVSPLTDSELTEKIHFADNADLSAVYRAMGENANADPEHRLWYLPWKITLRSTGECVGVIGFFGPVDCHSVEIYQFTEEKFREGDYASEALRTFVDWAFSDDDVYSITADADKEDHEWIDALEIVGFCEKDGCYKIERPQTNFTSLYMCLGMCMGVSLGSAMDKLSIGLAVGLCLGLALGTAADAQEKKKREAIHKEWDASK